MTQSCWVWLPLPHGRWTLRWNRTNPIRRFKQHCQGEPQLLPRPDWGRCHRHWNWLWKEGASIKANGYFRIIQIWSRGYPRIYQYLYVHYLSVPRLGILGGPFYTDLTEAITNETMSTILDLNPYGEDVGSLVGNCHVINSTIHACMGTGGSSASCWISRTYKVDAWTRRDLLHLGSATKVSVVPAFERLFIFASMLDWIMLTWAKRTLLCSLFSVPQMLLVSPCYLAVNTSVTMQPNCRSVSRSLSSALLAEQNWWWLAVMMGQLCLLWQGE